MSYDLLTTTTTRASTAMPSKEYLEDREALREPLLQSAPSHFDQLSYHLEHTLTQYSNRLKVLGKNLDDQAKATEIMSDCLNLMQRAQGAYT
jgi:RNA binding exosome subunit